MTLTITLDPSQINTDGSVSITVSVTGAVPGLRYRVLLYGNEASTREATSGTVTFTVPGSGWEDQTPFQVVQLDAQDNVTDASNVAFLRNGDFTPDPGDGGGDDDFGWPEIPLDAVYTKVEISGYTGVADWMVLTERWDCQLVSLDGLDVTPAVRLTTTEVEGLDGLAGLNDDEFNRLSYEATECSMSLIVRGTMNPDGTVQTDVAPQIRARDLKRELVRRTTGRFRVRVTALDGSVWINTAIRTGTVSATSEHESRDTFTVPLSFTFLDPYWRRVGARYVSRSLSGSVTLDELDGSGRITDAVLIINSGGDLVVRDTTNGSEFTYSASASGLTVYANKTTDPLDGEGDFKALKWKNSLSVLTIGNGRDTPQLSITGGSILITADIKSLNPF